MLIGSMRLFSLIIAALLVGGSLAYLAFGAHKGWGLAAGLVAVLIARFLVFESKPTGREGSHDND